MVLFISAKYLLGNHLRSALKDCYSSVSDSKVTPFLTSALAYYTSYLLGSLFWSVLVQKGLGLLMPEPPGAAVLGAHV